MNLRQRVKRSRFASLATFPVRLRAVASHGWRQTRRSFAWLFNSREFTNFTYDLTNENVVEMAWFVAAVTGLEFDHSFKYIKELHNDQTLLEHVRRAVVESPLRRVMDPEPRFGRRAAWYAIVRATRPGHVVETGVDKGLGSCVLAAALLQNGREGYPGRLTAIDINPDAGALIGGAYASVIDLRYGDSVAILGASTSPVDVFLHDSDHSYEHESAEYRAASRLLPSGALVMSDHGGLALSDFSLASGRRSLVFREDPSEHWGPGGVLVVATDAARTALEKTSHHPSDIEVPE